MNPAERNRKTVAIIQARMGSTRLPGKVLMDLAGTSILEIMLARVRRCQELDEIILATSTNPADDVLAYVADQNHIACHRGSENDVLDRYYQAAREAEASHIVRLTGDSPLADPEIIDRLVRLHHREQADISVLSNFPDGISGCVISMDSLTKAWLEAELPSEREHVTPWIMKRAIVNGHSLYLGRNYPGVGQEEGDNLPVQELFKAIDHQCSEDLSSERWTIDEPDDYCFLRELTEVMDVPLLDASLDDIRRVLDQHPKIRDINRHIIRNEGFAKSLEADTKTLGDNAHQDTPESQASDVLKGL